MNYDNWKTIEPEELDNECLFCGVPCTNDYCSVDCEKADILSLNKN